MIVENYYSHKVDAKLKGIIVQASGRFFYQKPDETTGDLKTVEVASIEAVVKDRGGLVSFLPFPQYDLFMTEIWGIDKVKAYEAINVFE